MEPVPCDAVKQETNKLDVFLETWSKMADDVEEDVEEFEAPAELGEETGSEEEEELTCPVCGSTDFETDETLGEIVCRECGAIIEEERIEESASRRAFTEEERQKVERTGKPVTFTEPARGMRTEVGRGSELRNLPASKRGQYYRIRKWQRRLDESRDRKMSYARGEFQRLIGQLGLPRSMLEEVNRLYEKALDKNIVKGRRIENIVAALVYIIARNQGNPRSLDEIADASGISKRDLGKTYRYVARELDLRIVPVNPEDFIPRYASELGIAGETQALARDLIMRARENNLLSGRSPEGIVASAIYIASLLEDEDITQKAIAEEIGVTEVTVRKGYNRIVEGLDMEEELEEARS